MHPASRGAATAGSLLSLLVMLGIAGCGGADRDGAAPEQGREVVASGDGADVPGAPVLPDSLAVSEDGSEVLADCWRGVCRWGAEDGRLHRVDEGSHVAVRPDWSLLAGVGDAATVLLVDPRSGDVVRELHGLDSDDAVDGEAVRAVVFSPDGRLVAASAGHSVIVWAVADGAEVAAIDGEGSALAFSPDGARLAVGGERIRVHDVASGVELATLPGSTAGANGLAWSADGAWIAGSGPHRAPTVWHADDHVLAARAGSGALVDLAFSPDSRRLAFTTKDASSVWLWGPEALGGDRSGVRELAGHTTDPVAVAFSPDGRRLYSVSGVDGVLAWDVGRGELLRRFELPER